MRDWIAVSIVAALTALSVTAWAIHNKAVASSSTASLAGFACSGIDPRDYGATGNGTTDDTAALNLAIADAQLSFTPLCLPPGTYSVTALTVSTSPHLLLTILGAGPDNSIISTSSATGDVLTLYKSGRIAHIGFTSSVARTSGSYIVFASGANDTTLDDFSITGAYTGILVQSGGTNRISNGRIRNTVPSGDSIIEDGGNDHYISYITIDGPSTAQPHSGIWHKSGGATQISHCDIIHQGYDLIINGGTVWTDHNYFDTAIRGWYVQASIAPVVRVTSDHDWMSNHTGNGVVVADGLYSTGSIMIRDATIINNAVNGIADLASGDIGLTLQGGLIANNGASGVYFSGSASRCVLDGARIGSVPGLSGNAAYGVYQANGIGDYNTWTNLDLIGNGVGPYYDGSTGTHNLKTLLRF